VILPVRCPLARYQDVLWSIQATVGDAPRTLLVDLGAGVFDRQCEGRRMSGEVLSLPLHAGTSLGFGEVEIATESIGALDIAALLPPAWPPVDGVVALDALARTPFTLDLGADELILETPTSLADRIHDGHALAIRMHAQIEGISLVVLVAVESPEGRLWFELDNSNVGPVIVSPKSAASLGIGDGDAHTLDVQGLGHVETAVVVRDIIYDGNIGRSVLDGRCLTFDLANELVVAT